MKQYTLTYLFGAIFLFSVFTFVYLGLVRSSENLSGLATASHYCADSDGGLNYYEYGCVDVRRTTNGESTWSASCDHCVRNFLQEHYCEGSMHYVEEHYCILGCSNSKCN